MPARSRSLGVGRVAADEVDARARRVLVEVGEDDDLLLVVVAAELVDEVAGGAVPAAHDDVVPVAGGTQTLALLEQEIDDHRDERAGDHAEHGDPEQDKQPADHPPARRGHEVGVALTEDRGDPPVERVEQRLERLRLLEQGDQDRRDGDGCPGSPRRAMMKNRRSSWPPTRRICHATRRMIGLARIGSGEVRHRTDRATPGRHRRQWRIRMLRPYAVGGSVPRLGHASRRRPRRRAPRRGRPGSRWRLTPWAPPPIATRSRPSIEASAMTGHGRVDPNGVIV